MPKKEDLSKPSGPDPGGEGDTELRNRKQGRQKQKKDNKTTTEENGQEVANAEQTQAPAQQQQQPMPQQMPYPQPDVIYIPANRVIFAIPKWICYPVLVIMAIGFVILGGFIGDRVWKYYYGIIPWDSESGLKNVIGDAGVDFFRQYDRDMDGKLSLEEYEAMYYRLIGDGVNITANVQYTQLIDEDDEVLTARASFKPLLLETMTKDFNESFLSDSMDSLIGLKKWTSLTQEWNNYGAKHFKQAFFPEDKQLLEKVGEVYDIYKMDEGIFAMFDVQMKSSNRYNPPKVEDRVVLIHRLLTMFHPRPFLRTRFAPQGAKATIRAFNDKYVDIVFRIHAEFQLNDPPYYPFWFTPAQFKGNLIISRDGSHIEYFHMYVPTDKRLNIDMEWLNGPETDENMEVDIGFIPQMEIQITSPSKKVPKDIQEKELPEDKNMAKNVQNMKWKKEISMYDAERSLEIAFYPFKKIVYYNFTDAFEVAKKENRLVHHILLWGALDDQSC